MLEVRLIGLPSLILHQAPMPQLLTPGFQALLGVLLLAPTRSVSRASLALTFWPQQPEELGRGNLRQLIHRLKLAWPECDQYLEFSRQSITWRSLPDTWVDLYELQRLQKEPITAAILDSVFSLLTGPLLQGHDQAWVEPYRVAFALRQSLYLQEALDWCQQAGLAGLELTCIQRLAEYAPDDPSVLQLRGGEVAAQPRAAKPDPRPSEAPPAPAAGAVRPPVSSSLVTPASALEPLRVAPLQAVTRETVLAQAIVLGDTFSWRLLADCLSDEAAVLDALEHYAHEGIWMEARDGTFAFVSPADRQARYARMSGAKRQALHSRVIAHLLAQPDHTPALLQTLTEHLRCCGDDPEAGRLIVLALRALHLQEAPQQLMELSTLALRLLDPGCAPELRWTAHYCRANAAILLRDTTTLDQDNAALRILAAEMPDLLLARTELAVLRLSIANLKSDINEILEASAERAALADAHGLKQDACEANLQLAIVLTASQRYSEAERVLERARGYAEQLENPEPMIHIRLLEGAQLMRKLELEAARDALQSISVRMNEVQDEGLRTRYLLHYSTTLISLGEHQVAAQALESLQARLIRRKLTYYADMVPFFLIRAKLEGGHYAEAAQLLEIDPPKSEGPLEAVYRRTTNRLDLSIRIYDLHEAEQVIKSQPHPPQKSALGLTFMQLNIDFLLAQARWEDALRLINTGLETARGQDSLQLEVVLKLRLARALSGMRDRAGAEWILREIDRKAPRPKLPWPPWKLELHGLLAESILAQQRPEEAWEVLSEAMPTLQRHPDRFHREHVLLGQSAELARMLVRPEEEIHRAQALDALKRRSGRMTPAQLERWMRAPEQVAVKGLRQWLRRPAQFRD